MLSTLTRTCFDNEPLEEFLRQLYLAEGGPQRFGKAKKVCLWQIALSPL